MNNEMIYELVNAGCDLRKLSPEFLEKLCGIYESQTRASAVTSQKPSKAEAIEALQVLTMNNDILVSTKLLINRLIDDIDSGYTLNDQRVLGRLRELSNTSLPGLPRALRIVRESLS